MPKSVLFRPRLLDCLRGYSRADFRADVAAGLTLAIIALEKLHTKLRRHHRWLLLAGPHTQPLMALSNSGFIGHIGPENVCENVDEALKRAQALLAGTAGRNPKGGS